MDDLSPNHNLSNNDRNEAELEELRSLLLGQELEDRLMNLKVCSEDVSRVLPEAILQHAPHQDALTTAAVPTVEDAIRASVNQDQNVLSEALFPVIGPATRKAVAAALQNLTQSLNEGLDHSLSPQSFQWRLEAARTGKSFAEIVLLRTLVYQVEQVLLIHKDTGLLLQQLVADTVIAQDADLVSAMLTAIQDFVKDSFSVRGGSSLNILQFGELTVWIEEGPQALLACVVRGTAPQEIREIFQAVLEKIHLVYGPTLHNYQGDDTTFEKSQAYLQDCLQARFKPKRKQRISWLWLLTGLVLLGIASQIFFAFQRRHRMSNYVTRLQQEPGLVIVDSNLNNRKVIISGMRDPLAADPLTLTEGTSINPEKIVATWEPYLSFHPKLVEARAAQRLKPPNTVSLEVNGKNTLVATGVANQNWIEQFPQQALQIPGVMQVNTDQLSPAELKTLRQLQEKVERQSIIFGPGATQPSSTSNNALKQLAQDLQTMQQMTATLKRKMVITIEGRTDRVGTESRNLVISQARANSIRDRLIENQVDRSLLRTKALGSAPKAPKQNAGLSERRVSFKVMLD